MGLCLGCCVVASVYGPGFLVAAVQKWGRTVDYGAYRNLEPSEIVRKLLE
jgi:hypothetical protein